jgi:hypothetical protein
MKKQYKLKLEALIEEAREDFYVDPKNNADRDSQLEVLGALVSNFCNWDYDEIELVVKSMLEDSNLKRMAVEL